MKQKNKFSLAGIWDAVKRHPLRTILVASLILQLANWAIFHERIESDSKEYISAADKILNGDIDTLRTPIYPLVIGLTKLIAPSNFLRIVHLVQILMYLLSGVVLAKTAAKLKFSLNIRVILSAIYLLSPGMILWQCSIITEPFSISMCIILTYLLTKWYYNQTASWMTSVYLCLVILFLVFIRPSFLYILVVLAAIIIFLICKHQYLKSIQMMICLLISGGLMFGYCKKIESETGILAPSTVVVYNTTKIAMNNGALSPDNITNPTIKQRVIDFNQNGDHDTFASPDFSEISRKEVYNELTSLKNKNQIAWYKNTLIYNIVDSINAPILNIGCIEISSFFVIYLLLFVFGVGGIYYCFKKRTVPFIAAVLWLMCMGNLGVNIFGSFAEWQRLFLPSLPLFMLLVAQFCNLLTIHRATNERKLL